MTSSELLTFCDAVNACSMYYILSNIQDTGNNLENDKRHLALDNLAALVALKASRLGIPMQLCYTTADALRRQGINQPKPKHVLPFFHRA